MQRIMKKIYASFLILLLSFTCFSLPSSASAEKQFFPVERAPSQTVVQENVFHQKSVDAISWIYANQGAPSELTASSSPLIAYQLEVIGEDDYRVIMRLNGQEVNAQYDRSQKLVTFQTNNLSGSQHVSVALEYRGKVYELTTWGFTVDPSPVDPFKNQNLTLLSTIQDEAITQMNRYRTALGLPIFTQTNSLQKAAQAHSNYLVANGMGGHTQEDPSGIGYTGSGPTHRGHYFGFPGGVGEGIVYEKNTGFLGIDELIDAPYHRLSIINPKNTFAGIGYNQRGDLVVNYGTMSHTEQTTDVFLYPYDNQNDAKTSWYVAENPNPLRFWGLDRIHVGYPISYAFFPETSSEQLLVTSLSLKDHNNREVPFYDITPERDDHAKRHVFLIPKDPLTPGETYSVNVTAFAKDQSNNTRDISKSWSFTTASEIDIQNIYFIKNQSNEFLQIAYNSGYDPNAIVRLKKNKEDYIRLEGNKQWSLKPIVTGDYTLTIESSLFNITKEIPVTITKNTQPRFDQDGDWLVSFNKMPPNPSIDSISIEPITNLSTEIIGKAVPHATIVMEADGHVLDTATASQDGTFIFPTQQFPIGTELKFYATNTTGDKSETISTVVTDVTGLDGYTNWTPSQTVPKTKDWTIRFNKEIDPTTVNQANFHVQYNRNTINDIDIVLNADKKSVTVKAPKDGYDEGKTYFLYIESDILTRSGKSLSQPIKFKFTVPMEN